MLWHVEGAASKGKDSGQMTPRVARQGLPALGGSVV